MKSKLIYKLLIWLLCFGLLFSIFVDVCISQEEEYKISITDKSYEINKIDENHEIIYYNILVTLNNMGAIESDNMTIRIMDEDNVNLTQQVTIMPGESKTFLFEDYPLIGLNDHEISIYYYPTIDKIYIPDRNNHGRDVLILGYTQNNGDNNTPGFGISIIILSVTLFVIINKLKK